MFGIGMTMREILIPLTLSDPQYGILQLDIGGDQSEKAETIAQTTGLLSIPLGLGQVFMM